ncbi:MAG: hypothetical protein KBC81_00010 [Candidatus Pacebacteria bacterium]|nr:hypothetical protein [Candidatus Paceibacterota bacterium]
MGGLTPFVLSELWAGAEGIKCEDPSGCDKVTFTVYLTDDEVSHLNNQFPDDRDASGGPPRGSGPAREICLKKMGKALCDDHCEEPAKEKWPPLDPGTMVKTTQENPAVTGWTREALNSRLWGVKGKIVTHHDSHGLSYEVEHPDRTIGHYDPTELEEIK